MKTKQKTRLIEVMICESGAGGDCGTWGTDYVEISSRTKAKNIEKQAIKVAWNKYQERDNIVHIALYNIPEEEKTVVCKLCDREVPAETAHRHRGNYVGECCWDERLKTTE